MAINDQSVPASKPAQDTQAAPAIDYGTNTGFQSLDQGLDFSDLLSSGASLVAPSNSSEGLEKVFVALTDYLKTKFNGALPKGWAFVKIDASANVLPASVLAVGAVSNAGGVARVHVTNLLIESTKVDLIQTQRQIANRTAAITTTLGQAFDDTAWAIVQKRVAEFVGVPLEAVIEVSTVIIPKDYDLVDKNSVTNLAYSATTPSALAVNGGAKSRLEMDRVAAAGKRFSTKIDFTGNQKTNVLGRPVRNDITVLTSLTKAAGANSTYQSEQRVMELSAYVDLNFTQPQALPPQFPGQAPVMSTQRYRPELVIADVASMFSDFDMTRALFSLTSVGALEKGSQWLRAFLSRLGTGKKNQLNLRDIGAIGYELDITQGKMIPTGRDVFSTEELQELVQTYFHQSPLISLEIDPEGPYNWVLNHFVRAGAGDPISIKVIVDAANTLTGNQFSKTWQGGEVCVVRHVMHNGTYVNDDNEVRPLSDIDYLAALNLFGGTDKQSFQRWVKSFEDQNLDPIERLADREELLRARLSSVDITGYSRRVTFHKPFLVALEAALTACGYHPNPENLAPVFGAQVVRGVTGLDQLAQGNFGQALYAGAQAPQGRGGAFGGRFTTFGG